MTATNYETLLNRSWKAVQKPKLLPVGSYELKCRGASFQMPKKDDGKPTFIFTYEPKEAMTDVPQEALDELGDYNLSNTRIFKRFWVENDIDLSAVRDHILKHGVEMDEDLPITDAGNLKLLRGTSVVAFLQQETYHNKATGEATPQNVAVNFAAAE